ncbi:MAG: sensor histidine kinase [Gammaproteobacteria bacterium]|nr:sensor histidine kinase [Gammaproteobacteria bacterium]
MKGTTSHHIRPAAKIIDTLGKGLIKDDLAAIIELVKNSYDADSESVLVRFEFKESDNTLIIVIDDSGHGMDYDTVINKWLVPGTSDKLERKVSPKKHRRMQGRKGIGRYAAGILGSELFLSSVDEKNNKTELLMDWNAIVDHDYLDEVEVLVENSSSHDASGTYIEIRDKLDDREEKVDIRSLWPDTKINKLKTELSKLLSPVQKRSRDKFFITLEFGEFPSDMWSGRSIEIEPLPLLRLYDYRVHGLITKTGKVNLTYENKCLRLVNSEKISFSIPKSSFDDELQNASTGKVQFDLRVFDRDPEAIEEIVKRAKQSGYTEMNKTEVKHWLNEFNGVGIYRGGFRIRPYGDREFDWLNLGARRVNIPAQRIGSNQIIGLLDIESEEFSGLEEKSARDGLVDNPNYLKLQKQIIKVIEVLERRRYDFRVSIGRGRKLVDVDRVLESLFNFDDVSNDVSKKLKKLKVAEKDITSVTQLILDAKEEKAKELADIKETIAYYQGQANLGKMVGRILHEGRKPVSYLRNSLPDVDANIKKLFKNPTNKKALTELDEETPFLMEETDKIHGLLTSLDPLAYKKGERSKSHKIKTVIQKCRKVFEQELELSNISVEVDLAASSEIYGRSTDFYWIFTNLLENSIYWLRYEDGKNKFIGISSEVSGQFQTIRVYDNGPGVSDELLEGGKIFEPGISAKDGGTGMGLSTAGELARRNGGDIWAISENKGISFYVRLPKNKETLE